MKNLTMRLSWTAYAFHTVWLLIFAVACTGTNEQAVRYETFKVAAPLVIDTTYSREYVADIQSIQNVEIRARVGGYITRVHVDEGQYVKKGQLLFSISDQSYREDVTQARAVQKSAIADVKAAEVDLQNVRNLVLKNVVNRSELEMAESKLEALKARVEEAAAYAASASLNLSFTQVKAPFDGILDRIPNRAGSLVNEGDLLTSISDNREVFAYFNLSENEYLDYSTAAEESDAASVALVLSNDTPHKYRGVVETAAGKINRSTGNISLRARFPNPDGLLKHGSSGKVRIETALNKALIIPQRSAFDVQDKTFVYVVDDDNRIRLRPVNLKYRLPHIYILESGLSEKERIVYEGVQFMQEGVEILPEPVQLEATPFHLSGTKQ